MGEAERDELTLTLDGEGVTPETVGIGSLSALLSAVADVAKAAGSDPADMALVAVRKGSAEFGFHSSNEAAQNMQGVIANAAVEGQPDLKDDLGRALDKVRRAIPTGMTLKMEQRYEGHKVAVELTRDGIVSPAERPIRGVTTLYGTVTLALANGDRASARIRPIGGGPIVQLVVSQELAEKFGAQLRQRVKVVGLGEWDPATYELKRMHVETVDPYRGGPIGREVKELGELVGDAWSDVDVVRYLDDLRGES